MKRTIKAISASALILMTGCSAEINTEQIQEQDRPIVVNVASIATKASLVENAGAAGGVGVYVNPDQAGESFSAYFGDETYARVMKFNQTGLVYGETVEFTGSLPANVTNELPVYALYPSKPIKNGNPAAIPLLLNENGYDGKMNKNLTYMYEATKVGDMESVVLQFEHLTSIVKFTMQFSGVNETEVKDVFISALSRIPHTAMVDITQSAPVYDFTSYGNIPIHERIAISSDGKADVFFHVFPQTIGNVPNTDQAQAAANGQTEANVLAAKKVSEALDAMLSDESKFIGNVTVTATVGEKNYSGILAGKYLSAGKLHCADVEMAAWGDDIAEYKDVTLYMQKNSVNESYVNTHEHFLSASTGQVYADSEAKANCSNIDIVAFHSNNEDSVGYALYSPDSYNASSAYGKEHMGEGNGVSSWNPRNKTRFKDLGQLSGGVYDALYKSKALEKLYEGADVEEANILLKLHTYQTIAFKTASGKYGVLMLTECSGGDSGYIKIKYKIQK